MSGAHTSVRSGVLQVALSSCATYRRGSAVHSWYRLVIGERGSLSLCTHTTLHTLSLPVKAHTRAVLPSTQLAGNRDQHRALSSWRQAHRVPRRDQRVRTTSSPFMRAAIACLVRALRTVLVCLRRRRSDASHRDGAAHVGRRPPVRLVHAIRCPLGRRRAVARTFGHAGRRATVQWGRVYRG